MEGYDLYIIEIMGESLVFINFLYLADCLRFFMIPLFQGYKILEKSFDVLGFHETSLLNFPSFPFGLVSKIVKIRPCCVVSSKTDNICQRI